MPPNPPSKRVASPRAAWRFAPCKYPNFSRKTLNPPRNEILDTPLRTPQTIYTLQGIGAQSFPHVFCCQGASDRDPSVEQTYVRKTENSNLNNL